MSKVHSQGGVGALRQNGTHLGYHPGPECLGGLLRLLKSDLEEPSTFFASTLIDSERLASEVVCRILSVAGKQSG